MHLRIQSTLIRAWRIGNLPCIQIHFEGGKWCFIPNQWPHIMSEEYIQHEQILNSKTDKIKEGEGSKMNINHSLQNRKTHFQRTLNPARFNSTQPTRHKPTLPPSTNSIKHHLCSQSNLQPQTTWLQESPGSELAASVSEICRFIPRNDNIEGPRPFQLFQKQIWCCR